MALFMDSDLSLLKQNQQKDVMDFNALFAQDHSNGEFNHILSASHRVVGLIWNIIYKLRGGS